MKAVTRQAAAMLLCYPDRTLFDRLDLIRDAVAGLPPGRARRSLERFSDRLAAEPELEAGVHFVRTFDLKRRRTLHMTYYADGDTRRRGHALARVKEIYGGCGWALDGAELPDHLAVVLEFAARGDEHWGERLLETFRPGIELLRTALHDCRTPYADVLDAVAATLPPAGDEARRRALRLAEAGPPSEDVGLEPFGGATPLGMPTMIKSGGLR